MLWRKETEQYKGNIHYHINVLEKAIFSIKTKKIFRENIYLPMQMNETCSEKPSQARVIGIVTSPMRE